MGYVPNCDWDVFISFANLDNNPVGTRTPWVTDFATDLETVLRSRLAVRQPDGLKFHFTGRHGTLGAGMPVTDSLLKAVRSTAAFVAVISPSYATEGEWPMTEFEEFQKLGSGRIFSIEIVPQDRPQDYPPALREVNRMPFWHGKVAFRRDSEAYELALVDLAVQIRDHLRALRETPLPRIEVRREKPREEEETGPNGPTLFLAQVTDDLGEERDKVRLHAGQFGIKVLPPGDYPLGGVDFTKAVAADLEKADIFVQLLGRIHAKRPPDLPDGYDRLQADMAAKRGIPILQWLRPDTDIDSIADPQHKALLSGEHVRKIGLEAFKAEVQRKALEPPPTHTGEPDPFIFINANRADIDLAQAWREAFVKESLDSAIPLMEGASAEIRQDLEERLMECDALLMIYGRADPAWVRAQALRARKLRGERKQPLRRLAICIGPPPEAKTDYGVDLKDCIRLDCTGGVTADSVRQFLAGLKQ